MVSLLKLSDLLIFSFLETRLLFLLEFALFLLFFKLLVLAEVGVLRLRLQRKLPTLKHELFFLRYRAQDLARIHFEVVLVIVGIQRKEQLSELGVARTRHKLDTLENIDHLRLSHHTFLGLLRISYVFDLLAELVSVCGCVSDEFLDSFP